MNDDWDGVDWAEHFAGPEDYDIEQAQEDGYQSSMEIDDYAVTEFEANCVTYDESTDRDDSEDHVAPAAIAYDFGFNNLKEVNAFAACIRRRGATAIRVTKHGALPPVGVEDHSWLPYSKTFSVAFKAEPLPALSRCWEYDFLQEFRVFYSLDQLSKLGYLGVQLKDNRVFGQMVRIDKAVNGPANNDISAHSSILVEAAKVVESHLAEGSVSGQGLDSDCSAHERFGCMFHFDFIKHVVNYAFYDEGFTHRVADQRVWDLYDGELFKEIFEHHPFDADDLDQLHFFYEMGAGEQSKIIEYQFAYPEDLARPLGAEKFSYGDGAGNPRMDAMIDSIDRTVGQRHLRVGETTASCFVEIDCRKKTIKFERRFYTPFNRIFRTGSLPFDSFALMAAESIEGQI